MGSTQEEQLQLALLIDGDNISPNYTDEIIKKVELHGEVTIRRVFGDFSLEEFTAWSSPAVQTLNLERVHVDRGESGGNSTDTALIAHAEALSAAALVDGVCVASCDGDFACLADPLKKAGRLFLVAAPVLASRKLVDACDRFIALDGDFEPAKPTGLGGREIVLLTHAVAMHKNKQGWAKLSAVANYLRHHSPSFANSGWGYRTLTDLLKTLGCFDIARYQGGAMRTRRRKASPTDRCLQ